MGGEQELQRGHVPPARPPGQRPAAEPRAPAAAERAPRPRPGDAVDREAPARLHAAHRGARGRTGDAVDAAAVEVHGAQRDLQRRDVRGGLREGGRGGEQSADRDAHDPGDELYGHAAA